LWAADPVLGTWKLNVEKSKYGSRPAPKSGAVTWAEEGGTFHYTSKGVGPDGQPTLVEIPSFKYDGKDYTVKGSPLVDTVAFTRADPQHILSTGKKDGKPSTTNKSTISKDGKTLTTVWQGTDASGKPQTWTTVLEKQ
jgi:hypothetical protein